MRYIKELDEKIIKELEQIVKEDKRHKSRYRAQAILLSNKGKSVNELADIFGCKIRTIYRWFDRFDAQKVEAVFELKGRGRKPILTIEDDAQKVKEYIKKTQYK
jgi:transposase